MSQMNWSQLIWTPVIAISVPAFATDYLSIGEVKKILFAEADEFSQQQLQLSDSQLDEIKKISGVRQRKKMPSVWTAMKKGKAQGLLIVDEVVGKHEFITYAVALTPEGSVIGLEILSYRETHGGAIRERDWRKNFIGKKITDPFKLDVDVPNISGATLSSRNVLDGVKRLLALQQVIRNG